MMSASGDPRRGRLFEVAQQLDLALSDAQAEQLLAYLDLLQRWNGTYNLTAVRDPERMLTQHVADCLAVITPLRRHLDTDELRRILDVGSGGGLPGAVFAI